MYYLQSRYFNPTLGRFISSDAFVSTGQGLLGNNMFAYCNNTSVNGSDSSGFRFEDFGSRTAQAQLLMDCALGGGAVILISLLGEVVEELASITVQITEQFFDGVSNLLSFSADWLSVEDELGKIASSYGNYMCKDAADKMSEHLKNNGMNFEIITVAFSGGRGYIWSDIAQKTVSENGVHVGILYNGLVFCNVHPYGLPEMIWVADFHGTGTKTVTKVPF